MIEELLMAWNNYHHARGEYVAALMEGEQLPYSQIEIAYAQAGKLFLEMLGAEPMPTAEEMESLFRQAVNRPRQAKPQTRTAEPRRGFVYLMRNSRNGYVKIGFSKNPEVREATLQSEEPEIELIAKMEQTIEFEQKLHERFAAQRVRGEWFGLSEEQYKLLQEEFA